MEFCFSVLSRTLTASILTLNRSNFDLPATYTCSLLHIHVVGLIIQLYH